MTIDGLLQRPHGPPGLQPLALRILLATVVTSVCIAVAATAVQLHTAQTREIQAIRERLIAIEQSYVPSLEEAVWSVYTPQILLILEGLLDLPDIAQVRVVASGMEPIELGHSVSASERIVRVYPLTRRSEEGEVVLGAFEVVATSAGVQERLKQQAVSILLSQSLMIFGAGIVLFSVYQLWVNRYLREIAGHARRLGVDSLASPFVLSRPRRARPDEIDQVVDAMNRMRERLLADVEARARAEAEVQWHRDRLEQTVAERTSELKARTRELERESAALAEERDRTHEAMRRLRDTQDQLVRSEKLASLGELVAGVAHEVNTPIGIALTVSSHLKTQVHQLELDFTANRLSRQGFSRFTSEANAACEHIEKSMSRAAALIRSFKQVSVDRTSEGRRSFEVGRFLSEVIAALKVMWKRAPVQIEVSCEPDLEMNSFPGPLGQVVSNLVQNAVIHGVGEGQQGLVTVTAASEGPEAIRLSVADDGAGIPAENREKVFDPFFTTRRGQGGSGLGLHIVHNLVTQKLGGNIEMTANSPRGSCFIVRIPRSAPTSPPASVET